MERRLSLEQRTERLVQRSQALLRPRARGPERAKPLLGSAPGSAGLDDPLVQWRSRRCRREEPALDAPLLGSAAPQGAVRGVPRGRSRDPPRAPQGAAPWESRDAPGAPGPIGRSFHKHQGASSPQAVSQEPCGQEPCWRPHDMHEALWPMRNSSLGALQGALYSQSRDSHEAPWHISSRYSASLHQGLPPCGTREAHERLRQETFWGSQDCLGDLLCAPYQKPRDSQDALRPAREALPEPLRQGGPDLRSRDPHEALQPISSSAHDAVQGAPLQQPLAHPGPLGDPLLWMLQCHRQDIRGRLWAIETLLECPPGYPSPVVGPIKQ